MKKKDKPLNPKKLAGNNLALNLKKLMVDRNLTQQKLADLSGVPRTTIANILIGRAQQMEWYTLWRLAQGLGCTMESIIGGSEIEIIKNPEIQRIIEAMPEGAKIFFRMKNHLPDEDVDAVIRIMQTIVERHKRENPHKPKEDK